MSRVFKKALIMKRDDSRTVAATKKRITDGLFEIMKHDPIDLITVSEACGRAGINRSTFYTHFSSIYDVRDRCEADITERVREVFFRRCSTRFGRAETRLSRGA